MLKVFQSLQSAQVMKTISESTVTMNIPVIQKEKSYHYSELDRGKVGEFLVSSCEITLERQLEGDFAWRLAPPLSAFTRWSTWQTKEAEVV